MTPSPTNNPRKWWSALIQKLRDDHGLTDKELALRLGVSAFSVYSWRVQGCIPKDAWKVGTTLEVFMRDPAIPAALLEVQRVSKLESGALLAAQVKKGKSTEAKHSRRSQ